MAPFIVLHIGANKTGSSAIQIFLKTNAAALRNHAVEVAPSDLTTGGKITGEHVWFTQSLLADIQAGARIMEERMEALLAGLPDGSRLIMSAENLANRTSGHLLFASLAKKFQIRVVLYIRRQDEYLLSSWQQWNSKISDDFWAWVISAVGQWGNWRACIEDWETVVPRDQITVRVFERDRLEGRDVIADFIGILGLSPHKDEFSFPAGDINPGFAECVVDLVKGNELVFSGVHDNGFYNLVRELTGERFLKNPKESIVSLKQREAILQKYRSANSWVKDNYFPEHKGELFSPPHAGGYVQLTAEELERQKWKLVASLIYGLSKRGVRK
ncbi:MAG: hypothetical protein ACT4SY_12760 [Hyphomicrobiales bacterium]